MSSSGPAEALVKLLRGDGVEGRGRITSRMSGIKLLHNGIRYFAVEVTCTEGVQYGISAYDEEAIELYTLAMGKFGGENLEPIPTCPMLVA